ncbi:MAG: SRPBCC domain-containing protein [Phycisphaerales bacterium]|nr:SRPBCC domain-containing protein [Phycisphaerales bacterium]
MRDPQAKQATALKVPGPSDKPQSVFRVTIAADRQRVWQEITRTDAPIACFFNSRMYLGPAGLTPGSKLAMRTPDAKFTGVVGEILECEPPARLTHTFRFTNLDDEPCIVRYDLREVDGGTEFTLSIYNATPGSKTQKQMVQGSKLITSTLKSVIETGKPSLGVRLIFTLMGLMSFTTPKRCRSEHWPVG